MIALSYAPNGLSATLNAAMPIRPAPIATICDFTAAISRFADEPGDITDDGFTLSAGGAGGCSTRGGLGGINAATFVSSTIFSPSVATGFASSGDCFTTGLGCSAFGAGSL